MEFIRDQVHKIPFFGAHGDEEIPVLIPNTEVKLISGDYTATSGKLARCRIIEIAIRIGWLFSLLDKYIVLNLTRDSDDSIDFAFFEFKIPPNAYVLTAIN